MSAPAEFSLDGQVAIVTGARGSLGRAIVEALAEAGADIVLCDREPEGMPELAAGVEGRGRQALEVLCDVTDERQVNDLVARTVERFGRLDICVANAGVFQVWLPPEQNTLEEWNRVVGVNLTGVMLTCLAAGRVMIERGGGSIVTISSIVGEVGLEGNFAYNAAKHGVLGVTRTLALEWARYGVRANAVCPGFCRRDPEPLEEIPEVRDLIMARTPLRRWGEPREIGLAVLYLASPASGFVTGIALPVDGGWLAQ